MAIAAKTVHTSCCSANTVHWYGYPERNRCAIVSARDELTTTTSTAMTNTACPDGGASAPAADAPMTTPSTAAPTPRTSSRSDER